MRKLLSILLLSAAMAMSIPGWSQNSVYSSGFETTNDNSAWQFANSANGWYIGTAAHNSGSRGLYVSNDNGTSNAYTISGAASSSYAYRTLTLNSGSYTVSFDWQCQGESGYDYLRVFLAPSTATFTAGNNNGISATGAPSGWIALDGGSKLSGNNSWTTAQNTVTGVTAGTYYLVFYWRNDGNMGSNPPAAVDNVSIASVSGGGTGSDCQTLSLPFSEGFESGALGCWTTDGPGNWVIGTGDNQSTTGAHGGTYNAKITHSSNNNATKLISPQFDMAGASSAQLSFWYVNRNWATDIDELRVYYRTSLTGSWQQLFATADAHETWTQATVTLPSGAVQVAFEMVDNYGYGVGIDDVSITSSGSTPYCAAPTDLAVQTVSSSRIVIQWNAGSGSQWRIKLNGTVVGNTSTGSTYILNGLNPNTLYTIGVATVCSDGTVSDYTTVTQRTACALITALPYTCDFEDMELDNTPTCWTKDDGGFANVVSGSANASSGSKYLRFSGAAGENIVYLPPFLVNWSNVQLRFKCRPEAYSMAGCGSFSVGYTSGDEYYTLATYNYNDWTSNVYQEKTVSLANLPADAYIFMRHDATSTLYYWFVDDVTVETVGGGTPAACNTPTGLTVSNITATSATLTWNGNGTSYSLWLDGLTGYSVSSTSFTLTGLTPGSSHTVNVWANCDGGQTSSSATLTFTTCDPVAAPYTWTFEDGTVYQTPDCWTQVDGQVRVSGMHAHGGDKSLELINAEHPMALFPETVDPISNLTLSFWLRPYSGMSMCGTFSVGYVTNVNDASTFVAVETYSYSEFDSYNSAEFTQYTVSFSNAPAGARMAFRTSPVSDLYEWYVDDITITANSTPSPVTPCDGTNVAIGSESSGTSSAFLPASTLYSYSLSETIIDASEIGGPMTIRSIDYYYSGNEPSTSLSSVDIYIKPTTKSTFVNTADLELLGTSSTLVYSGSLNCTEGWNRVYLTTSYVYNGSGNLMVIVDKNTGDWEGSNCNFMTASCTGNKTLLWYTDYEDANPDPAVGASDEHLNYRLYAQRAVMRLTDCGDGPVVCDNPMPLPFNEDFESVTATSIGTYENNYPACWIPFFTGPTVYYTPHVNNNGHNGHGLLMVSAASNSVSAGDGYMLLPLMNAPLHQLTLSFWYKAEAANHGTLTVGYVTGDDYSTFTPIASYASTEEAVAGLEITLPLSAVPSTATRLAFRWADVGNAWWVCYLDDVSLTLTPCPDEPVESSLCATGSYVWHGTEYTVSGDFTFTTTDANDCEVTEVLHLTVTPSCCPQPTGFTATQVNPRSATLTWDRVAGVDYSLTYVEVGTEDSVLVANDIDFTPYTVTGLTPNTPYLIRLKAYCSAYATSVYADVTVTTTECQPYALPYTEDYENYNDFDCWTVVNTDHHIANGWGIWSDEGIGGRGGCFRFPLVGSVLQYLISPELTGTANGVEVNFAYSTQTSSSGGNFMVGYSTTTADPEAFTWVSEVTDATSTYQRHVETFPASGIKYVAIKYLPVNSLLIDNFIIQEPTTSCMPVQNLAASDITSSSVILTWDASANTGATYSVSVNGVEISSGLTATGVMVTGLAMGTEYNFSVTAHCSASEASNPVTISAITACDVVTLPYTEDFEANGFYRCWTVTPSNLYNTGREESSSALNGTGCFNFYHTMTPPNYLISPELTGTENGVKVDFAYRAGMTNYAESFVVGYSTTTTDPEAFTWGTEVTNIRNTTYQRHVETLAVSGIKYVAVKYTAQWSMGTPFSIDNFVISEPSCHAVQNLTVSDITEGSLRLSWSHPSADNNTTYDIAVNGETYISNRQQLSFTFPLYEFTPNTEYTFTVTAHCSATETSAPISVTATTLACQPIALPYTEGFERGEHYPCWTYIDLSSFSYYSGRRADGSLSYNGSHSIVFYHAPHYLISPELTGTGNGVEVDFAYRVPGLSANFAVGYSTTTADPEAFTWGSPVTLPTNNNYQRFVEEIPISGIKYVAVKNLSEEDYYITGEEMIIDDFSIRNFSCRMVQNLAASDITGSSVTLSWNDASNSDATYSVSQDGVEIATGLTATTYTATGLTPNTTYTFSVTAHCSATEASIPVSVTATTVNPCLMTLPYIENFEADGNYACWTVVATSPYTGWLNYSGDAYNGIGDFVFSSNTDNNAQQYLISPELTGTGNGVDVDFAYYANPYFPESFRVGYSTTTNDPTAFEWHPWHPAVTNVTNAPYYVRHTEAFPVSGIKYVAIECNTSGEYSFLFIDNVNISSPSCFAVQNLVASDITSNSVTLSWNDASNSDATYSVSQDGVEIATGLTATTYTATGLTPNTTYTFSVTAHCSATEASSPVTITATPCNAVALPYTEDFEADGGYACWTVVSTETGTRRNENADYAFNGTGAFRFHWTSNPPQYLISPELTGTGNGVEVDFAYRTSTSSFAESFMVGYSTTTNDPNAFTWGSEVTNVTNDYYLRHTEIFAENGIKYVAIKHTAYDQEVLHIDNFTVSSCYKVQNLVASDITSNSVTLTWDDAMGSGRTYSVTQDGMEIATGLTATTYTATGLTPNTTYTFSVTAHCSATEASSPVTITATPCNAVALPYTEDFEADGGYACWTVVSTETGTMRDENAAYAFNGTVAFRFHWTTNPPQYLISPELTGTDNGVEVDFAYRTATSSYAESFMVGYSTTTIDPDAFTWGSEVTNVTNDYYLHHTEEFHVNGIKYVAIKHTSYDQESLFIDNFIVSSCYKVQNLVASDITSNSVTLTWDDAMGSGRTYSVTQDGMEIATGLTATTYTATGLTPNTTYTFSVTAHCSATEASLPVTITATPCNAVALPYTEDFEADGGYACWTVVSTETNTRRNENAALAFNGTGAFMFHWTSNPPQYLISPELTGTGNGVEVDFAYRTSTSSYAESFMVGYSTTTNDPDAFTWGSEVTNVTNNYYLHHTEEFPVNGIKYVAIKHTAYDQEVLHIDNLNIRCNREVVTACDSYTWHGQTYTSSGPHTDPATGDVLDLTINSSTREDIFHTECNSYSWYEHTDMTTSQEVSHTFVGANPEGCDHTQTLHLTINNCTPVEVTECESYQWHGFTLTSSDTYVDNGETLILTILHGTRSDIIVENAGPYDWYEHTGLMPPQDVSHTTTTASGCTHTAWLHLRAPASGNKSTHCDTVTTCDEYTWHGIPLGSSGRYILGNDTLQLTILQSTTGDTLATACNSFDWYEHTGLSGTTEVSHLFTAANGCDSVVTLHLTVNPCSHDVVTACDSYEWKGFTVRSSGIYTVGSDTLDLTIHQSSAGDTTAEVCHSFDWYEHTALDSTQTVSHTFVDGNTYSCDSVVTLHLAVRHCEATTVEACEGYVWGNQVYYESGTYTDGFDTLLLTIKHGTTGVDSVEACNSYVWHGTEYSAPTDSAFYLTTGSNGCDSVVTLHLTLTQCTTTEITACDSYMWRGSILTASGTYTDAGDTLMLTIRNSSASEESATACESYEWHGHSYLASGSYTYTTENADGCDSTVTLQLTLLHATTATVALAACDSYEWHGTEYTASGDYPYTTTGSNGCDSTVTLHLTVHYGTTGSESATACNSYSWHGTEYSTSGDYTYSTINSVGCDSVVTLHLMVNSCSTTEITACDNYEWHGTSYRTSGTYIDENDTLLLTVNVSTTAEVTAAACNRYHWHGNTYTNDGVYMYTTTNAAGCDSVVDLHLTLYHSITVDTTVAACDRYIWNGGTYTHEGTYRYTTTSVNGCDSTTNLTLIINHSVTTYDTLVVNESDLPMDYSGTIITGAGNYEIAEMTVAGCDSTVRLHVEVSTSGIGDIVLDEVTLYPNPTTGVVTISADNVAKVEVLDMVGRRVAVFSDTKTIDISHLAEGSYVVRITLPDSTAVRKVVKR